MLNEWKPLLICLGLASALIAAPATNLIAVDFVRGDFDANGVVDFTDAFSLLVYLGLGGLAPTCLDAADVNDSGAINIVDAVHLLHHTFGGQTLPATPFPNCGTDTTVDGLDCASYALCP